MKIQIPVSTLQRAIDVLSKLDPTAELGDIQFPYMTTRGLEKLKFVKGGGDIRYANIEDWALEIDVVKHPKK